MKKANSGAAESSLLADFCPDSQLLTPQLSGSQDNPNRFSCCVLFSEFSYLLVRTVECSTQKTGIFNMLDCSGPILERVRCVARTNEDRFY